MSDDDLRRRARTAAQDCIGCEVSVRYKTGSTGTALARGPIIKCEPIAPRLSKSGLTLKALWRVTLRLASGKLHEATLDRLPCREPLAVPGSGLARPDWDKIGATVKLVKQQAKAKARQ